MSKLVKVEEFVYVCYIGINVMCMLSKNPKFLYKRSHIRQDYPLNLSILISGGKETNQDSPSNGE